MSRSTVKLAPVVPRTSSACSSWASAIASPDSTKVVIARSRKNTSNVFFHFLAVCKTARIPKFILRLLYSICAKICFGFSRIVEILDTSTAATSRTPPTIATSMKCCGVTMTFSAALPNSVPRVPAICLLER